MPCARRGSASSTIASAAAGSTTTAPRPPRDRARRAHLPGNADNTGRRAQDARASTPPHEVLYVDVAVLLRLLLRSICFTLLAAALIALTPGGVHADGVRGRVSAIVDGDTLHIDIDGHATVVRLLGVDAPELHDRDDPAGRPQAFARAAADFTRRMLAGRRVRLEV